MTTIEMEHAISRRYDVRTHLMVPNVSWGALSHEADVLVVRQSGHCLEFEIKRTFADYKKDFEKAKWRKLTIGGETAMANIKEFWYVFPAELWFKRENSIRELLPPEAGVLIIHGNGSEIPYSRIIRGAASKKGAKALTEREMFNIARLGTMRIWNLKRNIIQLNYQLKKGTSPG